MAKPLRLRAPFLRVSIGALAPCNNPDACRITLVECLVGSALPPSKHACSAWQDASFRLDRCLPTGADPRLSGWLT